MNEKIFVFIKFRNLKAKFHFHIQYTNLDDTMKLIKKGIERDRSVKNYQLAYYV